MAKRITQQEFIRRASSKHGDKYDYSKSVYLKSSEKITITCRIHGDFLVTPSKHWGRGDGCARCGGVAKMTTADYVAKAKLVHGEKYCYKNLKYTHAHCMLIIDCKKHGSFTQAANSHLKGSNCPKCANTQRGVKLSTDEVISGFIEVHGSRYDYSLVEYLGTTESVEIICSAHGAFRQKANIHMGGSGCQLCARDERSRRQSLDLGHFLNVARDVHGDRYTYARTVYTKMRETVIITCATHGDFEQIAGVHLSGFNCPKCHYQNVADRTRWDNNKFTEMAKSVHGERYDYSLVAYDGSHRRVDIVCTHHGVFKQIAGDHVQGSGCPECGANFNRNQATEVYLMTNGQKVKVGISTNTDRRLTELNNRSPFAIEHVKSWTLPNFNAAYELEQRIHKHLAHLNAGYEGFDGATEWFDIAPLLAVTKVGKLLAKVRGEQ